MKEPCLSIGDLLIALESSNFSTFYTMNGKESQHLCPSLKQNFIVRPRNPEKEDIECLFSNLKNWEKF